MIKIRSNVFETNSSSTHSVCLETGYKERFTYRNIPKNTIINITSKYYYQFEDNGVNETEWQKLNLLIDFILGIKIKYNSEKHLCKDYIEILEKVVKDKRNSIINFEFDYKKRSPYYGNLDEDEDIFSLFNFKPNDNTESVYNIFKNCLFNEYVVVRYREIMD